MHRISRAFLLLPLLLTACPKEKVVEQSITKAAELGDLAMLEKMVAGGAKANDRNNNGLTPLYFAHDRRIAERLIGLGGDVNDTAQGGLSPLGMAVGRGNADVVQTLLEHGAKITDPMLRAAVLGKHTAIVRMLVDAGADVNHRDTGTYQENRTPLCYATTPEIATILLDHKADIEARTTSGRTALHLKCALPEWSDIVALLLERGADPNVRDTLGKTPLHLAAEASAVESVTMLVTHGAIVDARDREGGTPLFDALIGELHGFGLSSVMYTLNGHILTASTYDPPSDGSGEGDGGGIGAAVMETSPRFGMKTRTPILVGYLLDHGAAVEGTLKSRITPLQIASGAGFTDIVDTLLAHHADPNRMNTFKVTPLAVAEASKKDAIVRKLRAAGAKK